MENIIINTQLHTIIVENKKIIYDGRGENIPKRFIGTKCKVYLGNEIIFEIRELEKSLDID